MTKCPLKTGVCLWEASVSGGFDCITIYLDINIIFPTGTSIIYDYYYSTTVYSHYFSLFISFPAKCILLKIISHKANC